MTFIQMNRSVKKIILEYDGEENVNFLTKNNITDFRKKK